MLQNYSTLKKAFLQLELSLALQRRPSVALPFRAERLVMPGCAGGHHGRCSLGSGPSSDPKPRSLSAWQCPAIMMVGACVALPDGGPGFWWLLLFGVMLDTALSGAPEPFEVLGHVGTEISKTSSHGGVLWSPTSLGFF